MPAPIVNGETVASATAKINESFTDLSARALLVPAPATITYAASVALDITAINRTLRTISLTGNLTLTTTNRVAGARTNLRLICDATIRTLTFPAGWIFVGAARPADIAASKTGLLVLEWFGTTDTDCIAFWRVEP